MMEMMATSKVKPVTQNSKEHLKSKEINTVTQLKEMEISDLSYQELKIAILKKLNELHESTERQFKEIRETIHTHTHSH